MPRQICLHVNFICALMMSKQLFFKLKCAPLYTAHLGCSQSKGQMNKIKVAYNDTLRILLKYQRWESASKMLRNSMFTFMCRPTESRNGILRYLTDPNLSETRYSSSLWKYWNQHLYLF